MHDVSGNTLFFEYAYVPELQSVIDAFNFVPNTKTEFEEFETSDGLGRTTDHEKSYGAGFNATVVYTEKPCPHFLTLVKHKLGKFYDTPLSKRYKDLPPVEERTPNMVFEATKRIIDYFGIREQITYTDEQMRSIIANIGEDGSKLSELPLYLGDRGEPFEPARRQFCYDRNFNLDAYRNARDHKRVKGSDAEKIIPFSKEGKIRRSLSI